MKTRKGNCVVCGKEITQHTWIRRSGITKGITIVKGTFCSKRCHKKFRLLVALDDIIEQLEELK